MIVDDAVLRSNPDLVELLKVAQARKLEPKDYMGAAKQSAERDGDLPEIFFSGKRQPRR